MKVLITEAARLRVKAESERSGLNQSQVVEKLIRDHLPPAAGESRAGLMVLPDGTLFNFVAGSEEELETVLRWAHAQALKRMREATSAGTPQV